MIGAGDRGARAYAPYALNYPNELQIVAVADPNDERRNRVKVEYELEEDACYTSWEELLQGGKKSRYCNYLYLRSFPL